MVGAQGAATGVLAGTTDAAAVEAEIGIQRQLQQQIAAVTAARERDAAVLEQRAALADRLEAEVNALRLETETLQRMVVATEQGSAAIAVLNRELEVRNALLRT